MSQVIPQVMPRVFPQLRSARDFSTPRIEIPETHRTESPAYMIPSQDRHLISDASVLAAVAAMAPLGAYCRNNIRASQLINEEKNASVGDYTLAA